MARTDDLMGVGCPAELAAKIDATSVEKQSNGYVGIGTNAPAKALHIVGVDANSANIRIQRGSTTWDLTIGSDGRLAFTTAGNETVQFKSAGQVNFKPQAQPVSATAGDVYYDITANKLKCYNGSTWNDLF